MSSRVSRGHLDCRWQEGLTLICYRGGCRSSISIGCSAIWFWAHGPDLSGILEHLHSLAYVALWEGIIVHSMSHCLLDIFEGVAVQGQGLWGNIQNNFSSLPPLLSSLFNLEHFICFFRCQLWGLYTPTAFPSRLQVDSVGLRVSRIHIFLLFHHSIFPRIFQSWSDHFWPDQSVQRTFPMDCQWTNNKPATEMTRTDGIPTDIANGSLTEFRRTRPTEVRRKSNGLQASRLIISITKSQFGNHNTNVLWLLMAIVLFPQCLEW